MVILRDRLNEQSTASWTRCGADDLSVGGIARVKARSLGAEIAITMVKIHRKVPAMVAAVHKELLPPPPPPPPPPYNMRREFYSSSSNNKRGGGGIWS
jgi:hypothetical protein